MELKPMLYTENYKVRHPIELWIALFIIFQVAVVMEILAFGNNLSPLGITFIILGEGGYAIFGLAEYKVYSIIGGKLDDKKHEMKNFLKFIFKYLFVIVFFQIIFGYIANGFHSTQSANQSEIDQIASSGRLDMVILVFSAVIVGPFIEEVLFRGILAKLIKPNYLFLKYLLSSFLFGFAHVGEMSTPIDFIYIASYGTIGAVLMDAYEQSGEYLKYDLAVHQCYNLFAFICSLI